jgi:hypothetical protein
VGLKRARLAQDASLFEAQLRQRDFTLEACHNILGGPKNKRGETPGMLLGMFYYPQCQLQEIWERLDWYPDHHAGLLRRQHEIQRKAYFEGMQAQPDSERSGRVI